MTIAITPDDLAAMRAEHYDAGGYCGWCQIPITADTQWPCDVVRLLDEVARLRRFESLALGMLDELAEGSWPAELWWRGEYGLPRAGHG